MTEPASIRDLQLRKLRHLVTELRTNSFQAPRIGDLQVSSLGDLRQFPLTTKDELVADRESSPPWGKNLTYPLERYTRFCQSSGTAAGPLPTLDTPESWDAMLNGWDQVFEASGVSTSESIFFAFSFGPFLGFWTAFEAATRRGNLSIPGGGMSSDARLEMLGRYEAEVLCCTPTYAIRLGEIRNSLDQPTSIERIIVAGEPGGSIPEVRSRIMALWPGATVHDHHGMTEVGPVTYEPADLPGSLVVIEESFLAEVLNETGDEVAAGEEGELVLTTLDRIARPLIRYRTGDLVRKGLHEGRLCLDGGILGRADDMVVIRGVNIYPAAIERIVRQFPEVVEFQTKEYTRESMAELELLVEVDPSVPDATGVAGRIQVALSNAFALRVPVILAEPDSLPRFEFKARRWIKC